MINGLKKWIRILVGVFYILSGLLKLMDPVGTGLIVEAYFRFMHLYDCMGVAKGLGVFIGAFETIIGIAAVLCLLPKFMRIVFLFVQAAFTLISLALVIWNPQMHCGCFGEAIHLTHWQTLIKNIVLMGMLWFAYVPLLQLPNAKMWQYIAFASSVALMAGFAVYSWYFIPVIDFTDYKKGTKIVSQSEYWKLSEEEKENRATLPMLGSPRLGNTHILLLLALPQSSSWFFLDGPSTSTLRVLPISFSLLLRLIRPWRAMISLSL